MSQQEDLGTLRGVLIFSMITGFFISVWFSYKIDATQEGLSLMAFDAIANAFHLLSYVMLFVSIIITSLGLLKLYFDLKKISEGGILNWIVAGLGFFGMLIVASQHTGNIYTVGCVF